MKRKLQLSALIILLFSISIIAQVPRTISVQGILTDGDGAVVSDGSYDLTFNLYLTSDDDAFVWTESHTGVEISQGVFNVILGSNTGLNLSFDQPYFLGIQNGTDPELLPRIPFTASPYSLFALSIADSIVTSSKLTANAVSASNIEPDIISSLNNVSNDGGNINLVAGASMSITNNDTTDEIIFSVIGGNGAIGQIDGGDGINVVNPNGPAVEISIEPNSIGTSELEPNVSFGPAGSVVVQNAQGESVARLYTDTSGIGYVTANIGGRADGVGLSTNNDGGYVFVNDNSTNERARMITDDQGNGYVNIFNEQNIDVSRLASTSLGNGIISVDNAQGNITSGMTGDVFGGYIFVLDTSGNERARMTAAATGNGHVSVDNDIGQEVAEISSVQGSGYIAAYNTGGNLIGLLTGLPGGGSLTLYNNAGIVKGSMSVTNQGAGVVSVRNIDNDQRTEMSGGLINLTDANGATTITLDGTTGNITSNSRIVSRAAMIDETKAIYHTALEGPEAAAYYRGTANLIDGEAIISLPEHFALIASPEGLTVQLTPRSAESEGLAVISLNPQEIRIKELRKGKGNYEFDYIVHAVQKKYTDFQVIQDLIPVHSGSETQENTGGNSAEPEMDSVRDQILERRVKRLERDTNPGN